MQAVSPSAVGMERPEPRGAVRMTGIAKQFGATSVLRGIDLDIRAGEFITILGPSGCGKSTLLRIIAGLEPQSAGTVAIDGVSMDGLPPDRRDIAMVFQSYALYPHLTVAENIAVPLRMRRLTRLQRLPGARTLPAVRRIGSSIGEAVQAVAATLRLESLLGRKPAQLSGGQKQRVALARAMVRQPKAFLMDEPLSNLDAELRVHMRAEIAQLHRQLGATFIYVTHDQAEAMTMSDRVAVILEGELRQIASPGELYRDPDDLRVAQFVGTPRINVLPAVATAAGIDVLGLPIARQSGLPVGMKLQAAVRPERLAVAGPGVPGRVVYRENLGSDLFLHVAVDGASTAVIVRCDSSALDVTEIGTSLRLAIPPDALLLFDLDGRRLRP
ncbi:carbohydrate ABC transporter ATP-binding protein, CUT1 family [Rhodospirillales bacterium URHD0017]|nr:carbohydrate ABC transporter ATP-binding protein, CUT1 family [Rhodospirillales bacterium URHD0017]